MPTTWSVTLNSVSRCINVPQHLMPFAMDIFLVCLNHFRRYALRACQAHPLEHVQLRSETVSN